MRLAAWTEALLGLGCLVWATPDASAQQVTVTTPYASVSDSFFENMGTSFGLRGPNWSFSLFGSPTQAAPQFGGFDPSAGASFGFGFGGGGVQGSFAGNFSQGSRRSLTSVAPSITLQNGVPGSISDTSQSPFVISYIPVVGGFPTVGALLPAIPQPSYPYEGTVDGSSAVQQALRQARAQQRQPSAGAVGQIDNSQPQMPALPAAGAAGAAPGGHDLVLGGGDKAAATADKPQDAASQKLAAAQSSLAGRPAMSVAEARRLHQAEQADERDEVLNYVRRAKAAEAAGKPNVAKIYYQMAVRRASTPLRQQIRARLSVLEASP